MRQTKTSASCQDQRDWWVQSKKCGGVITSFSGTFRNFYAHFGGTRKFEFNEEDDACQFPKILVILPILIFCFLPLPPLLPRRP